MTDRSPTPLLSVSDLRVSFPADQRHHQAELLAVDGISLTIERGETLGIVGESGSGKSITAYAILGLVPPPGRITSGSIQLDGRSLLDLAPTELRQVRGNRISMIFQEPMTALNPTFTIGNQIAEAFLIHNNVPEKQAFDKAVNLLDRVGINDPGRTADAYPHQLSGGMRQRAMIAMALICEPELLIADEPTTALDTTIQAQILDLLLDLQDEFGMAMLFISHNIAVISEIADRVAVMYAGNLVEAMPATTLAGGARHPYTVGLIQTLPQRDRRGQDLPTLEGVLSDLDRRPDGCSFAPRCPFAEADCTATKPLPRPLAPMHDVACIMVDQ